MRLTIASACGLISLVFAYQHYIADWFNVPNPFFCDPALADDRGSSHTFQQGRGLHRTVFRNVWLPKTLFTKEIAPNYEGVIFPFWHSGVVRRNLYPVRVAETKFATV